MRNNILRLIKDDIKVTRLINTLESLEVSAHRYTLGNVYVVFSLLGIQQDDQNLDLYFKMIEQGEDLEKYDSNEKIEELAEGIFKQLLLSH